MKRIYRIARLELSTMFYSPIAWLLLIVFIFQNALHFSDLIETIESNQQTQNGVPHSLGFDIFIQNRGLYPALLDKIYLYIPLLTMGLISREISSGSIKLLLSSPVRTTEIVLGKYLAMMIYGLLLAVVILILVVSAGSTIEHFDFKYILTGLLAFYLLICTYAAIGLFMSCLTSYQVVAAISTLAVLAALNYINLVWQSVPFVRDITYYLSISGRAEKMIHGLISSKDVIYFLLFIVLFLGFSVFKLRAGRESVSIVVKAGRYVILTIAVLAIGYFSSRPAFTFYKDVTANQEMTISKASQDIIGKLKEPVTLTTYVNLMGMHPNSMGSPADRNEDIASFENYIRFMPNLKMDYVYYYAERKMDGDTSNQQPPDLEAQAKKQAKAIRVDFSLFRSYKDLPVDLRPENYNNVVRCFTMGNQSSFLRYYFGRPEGPTEQEITVAIQRLTEKAQRIGFVTGHNERSIASMQETEIMFTTTVRQLAYSIINQGFDPFSLTLASPVPADVDILVIADPKAPYSPAELANLEKFIAGGGNLMICGEPGKTDLINPILMMTGVSMNRGQLLQLDRVHKPVTIQGILLPRTKSTNNRDTYPPLRPILLEGAAGLSYVQQDAFEVTPLITTDPATTWTRLSPLDPDSLFMLKKNDDDISGPACPALAMKRKVNNKEQRILVFGDVDFMSNGLSYPRGEKTGNTLTVLSLYKWLGGDRFPPNIAYAPSKDVKTILTADGVDRMRVAYTGVLPGLILALAAFTLIRRARR